MLPLSFKREPCVSTANTVRFVLLLAELQHNRKKHVDPIYALLTERGYFLESHISRTLWHLSFLLHIKGKRPSLGFSPFLRIMYNTKRDVKLHMCKRLSHIM